MVLIIRLKRMKYGTGERNAERSLAVLFISVLATETAKGWSYYRGLVLN